MVIDHDKGIPIGKNENVEFSEEVANHDDIEALKLANEANNRQEKNEHP